MQCLRRICRDLTQQRQLKAAHCSQRRPTPQLAPVRRLLRRAQGALQAARTGSTLIFQSTARLSQTHCLRTLASLLMEPISLDHHTAQASMPRVSRTRQDQSLCVVSFLVCPLSWTRAQTPLRTLPCRNTKAPLERVSFLVARTMGTLTQGPWRQNSSMPAAQALWSRRGERRLRYRRRQPPRKNRSTKLNLRPSVRNARKALA